MNRAEIASKILDFAHRYGRDSALEILRRFDANRLADVPETQWRDLYKAFSRAAKKIRRQKEATFKKCKCGNTLGLQANAEGRELCISCQQAKNEAAAETVRLEWAERRIDELRYAKDVTELANGVADLLRELLPRG